MTTVGSSAGKKPVRPGQTVTLVAQVSCLGLSPLCGDRVRLRVTLRNGSIEAAGTDGLGKLSGDTATGTFTVDLGELGPVRGKKGHIEGIAVVARVTGQPGTELTFETELTDLKPGSSPEVWLGPKSRTLELKIDE